MTCEIDPDRPITLTEALSVLGLVAFVIAFAITVCGCVYKGGKVNDGTNLAIGMKIPGTEWNINVLDYVGGLRVAGQDSTHIKVTNEVDETNSYFGVVQTERHSRMTADIEPLDCSGAAETNAVDSSEE